MDGSRSMWMTQKITAHRSMRAQDIPGSMEQHRQRPSGSQAGEDAKGTASEDSLETGGSAVYMWDLEGSAGLLFGGQRISLVGLRGHPVSITTCQQKKSSCRL